MRWIERLLSNYLWALCCVFSVDLEDHRRADERRRYGAPPPAQRPLPYL